MTWYRGLWLAVGTTVLWTIGVPDMTAGQLRIDAQDVPVLKVTEEWRIGSIDDPEDGFSRIGQIAVDGEGNIYVVEAQDSEIRVFSESGVRLRTMGGSGQGPGEFLSAGRMGIRGDTVWVHDHRLNRVTLFSVDGEVVSTFPSGGRISIQAPPGVSVVSSYGVMREDGFIHREEPAAAAALPSENNPTFSPPDSLGVPIIRIDRRGEIVDTVDEAVLYLVDRVDEGSPRRPPQTDMMLDPGPPADTPLRFRTDEGIIVVDRRAAASGEPAELVITRVTGEGETVYETRVTYEPRPFSPALSEELRDRRGEIEIPAFQAPVSGGLVGEGGMVGLRREADRDPEGWLIIGADGVPRGRAQLPTSTEVRWMGRDVIYAVATDELDIPWLVKYRLDPG